jgi:uncharacterized caspase-like protein
MTTTLSRFSKLMIRGLALVPFVIGAGIAVGKFSPERAEAAFQAPAVTVQQTNSSRIALIVGNADYPDANEPLAHPVTDGRAMAAELRARGFDVDLVHNAGREDMQRAVERFKARIRPGVTAMLFYSGFGVQVDRQSYMIPVDAQIWKEADVRRDGASIDALLAAMNERGAAIKLVVLDASRRNPFERRFRSYSNGLAAIDAPQGTLIISSATPGKVAYDAKGENSLVVAELLRSINAPGITAEAMFNRARVNISRSTKGEQVPSVSSSLVEDFALSALRAAR